MKDDTISRQAAIQTAERMYRRCDTSSIEDYHDLMVDALTALPSAQPDVPGINVIIDTIKNAINASTGNEAYMVGLRNGMRWCWSALTDKEPEYEDMLPAQPGWIPCTPETMPKENGEYLVTIKWDEGDYDVDIYEYDAYFKEWNDGELYGDVIAWQPLPTPYREGGQS